MYKKMVENVEDEEEEKIEDIILDEETDKYMQDISSFWIPEPQMPKVE